MTKLSYTREGTEFAIETATLPEAAITYLLQYGFAQSLQDSIAGRAKAVRDEMVAEGKKEGNEAPTEAEIAEAIKQDLLGTLEKRMNAIMAGTVATRSPGAPKDEAAGIVREILLAHAKSKGLKLPKADSDEYAALAAKVREAKADYIKGELARRKEAVALDIEL